MIRFLELLIAVVIVAVFYVIVGVFLPDQRKVQHAMETNHPIRQVYDTLNGFKRFGEWHPLRLHDPRIVYTLEGEERGVGARLRYQSQDKRVGAGSFEIVESQLDEFIVMRIENEAYGFDKLARFDLREKGKTVEIKWSYGVEYGWSLPGRYAGMYVTRTVGDDIKAGLANLVGLIATMPNFDYKMLDIQRVDVAPERILYVSTTSDRNITAVENAMIASLDALRKAIADNRLEATGPARLITTSFGSEKYEFDVAIPFRAAVESPAAGEGAVAEAAVAEVAADGATPADAGTDTAAAPVAASPIPIRLDPIEGLRLPENVLQGQSYQGRALRTVYQGHPAALPLIRDQLRSYAAATGEVIQDRAFEEYLSDIQSTAAEDASFNVYWPVR